MKPPGIFRKIRIWLGLGLAAILITVAILCRQPDRHISFSRDVPSTLPASRLQLAIDNLGHWPDWFHSLKEARLENPQAKLEVGQNVVLSIVPTKSPWKKFELTVQITEFVPTQTIAFRVVNDSKHRLSRMFDDLQWRIQFLPGQAWKTPPNRDHPQPMQTVLRGEVEATTKNWRARLFSRLSPDILLNQTFYPDLIKMAELGKDKAINPFTAYQNQ